MNARARTRPTTKSGRFASFRRLLSGSLLLLLTFCKGRDPGTEAKAEKPARIVSLSPAITDTLIAIGAEGTLVGVSQFCRPSSLPRVGTAITPDFERIAELSPSLIVSTTVAGSRRAELTKLAEVVDLPWLSLQDVVQGTRRLGTLSSRPERARALAHDLEQRLAPTALPDAPRVLALLGDFQESELFYVRSGSLHGSLLLAAGFRNAMPEPGTGPPRLSVEDLLDLDPDAIVFFREPASGDLSPEQLVLPVLRLRPLTAVREGRVTVYSAKGLLSMGPGVKDHVQPFREHLAELFSAGDRRPKANPQTEAEKQ